MALFEYKCKDCGAVSEVLVFSSEDTPACDRCGSENMEKMLSSFAVSMGSSRSADAGSCATGACPMSAPGGCASGTCGLM